MLLLGVVAAPLAPTPSSAEPWPPAPNMAPGPNSAPGSPFWGGGGGGKAAKGGATRASCPPVESCEPCGANRWGAEGRRDGSTLAFVLGECSVQRMQSGDGARMRGLKILPITFHSPSQSLPSFCAWSPPPHSTSISLTGMCFQSANHEIFTANTSIIKTHKIWYTLWHAKMLLGLPDTDGDESGRKLSVASSQLQAAWCEHLFQRLWTILWASSSY